jgi:DNA polymerase-3 subunit gamma/tau
MAQDSPAALASLANLLDRGHDLRAFCAEIVEHIRNVFVAAVVPDTAELRGLIETSEDDLNQLSKNAKALTPEQLQELLAIFIQAEDSLRFSSHPRFVMETAAVRATRLLRQREGAATHPVQTVSSSSQRPSAELEGRKGGPSTLLALRQGAPVASRPSPKPAHTSRGESDDGQSISPEPSHNPPTDAATATLAAVPPIAVGPQPTLQWELVQEEVAASFPNIAPFLEAGRFVGMDGGFVTIGFAKQATVARARLEKEENLLMLSRLCEHQMGYPIRVRIIELTETDPPGPTMAQVRAAKEQEQRLVLFERAKANPTVKHALEIFGVELAEVRTITEQEAS